MSPLLRNDTKIGKKNNSAYFQSALLASMAAFWALPAIRQVFIDISLLRNLLWQILDQAFRMHYLPADATLHELCDATWVCFLIPLIRIADLTNCGVWQFWLKAQKT